MKSTLWVALLLGLAAAATAANPTPAISNGENAPKGRFRYMASLWATDKTGPKDGPFCDGTLISPWVVLTAAHCVRDTDTGNNSRSEEFKPLVRIGGYMRTEDAAGDYQERRVKTTVVHPKFKTSFSKGVTYDHTNYDVALLLLSEPSSMPTMMLVGPAYKPALPVPAGTLATVVGWGAYWQRGDDAKFLEPLQLLEQKLLTLKTCQDLKGDGKFKDDNGVSHEVHFNFNNNSMICAARNTKPTGVSCGGDSGGPLFVAGADASKDYQIGIVSWGPSNCDTPTSVYTDVGMVFKWIDDTVFHWTHHRLTPWNRPAPFRPVTGSMLADNAGKGFDGKPFTYSGAAGKAVDIVSAAPKWYLNGILTNGSAPGTQALGYVAWNLGARVEALIGRKGRMVVNLNKTPIWQGTKKKLGSLVTIDYASERCSHRSCAPRQLDITVRPFIKITVTQPWIPGAMPGARGSFAPYLEVKVVLTEQPKQQLTGYLGHTIAG